MLARTHSDLHEFPAAAEAAGHGIRLAPQDAGLAEVMALARAELGDRTGARAFVFNGSSRKPQPSSRPLSETPSTKITQRANMASGSCVR